MARLNDRGFLRQRKICIKSLQALEKRFSPAVAQAAMRKHLLLTRERRSRLKQIAKLQHELNALR